MVLKSLREKRQGRASLPRTIAPAGCPRATPARRAGTAPLDFWLRVGQAPSSNAEEGAYVVWGRGGEAGGTNRTPHLRPRRGGGSRASGGRLSVCGHYPRGSRQRRDRCLIGASALQRAFSCPFGTIHLALPGICTKRLEGTSAAPTGNPGWRLRHTGCVLRADAALCLTNEPARLSSGRWPAAPKGGMPKGGTPFGALLHPFGAFQKDGVPRGRNPAQGCPWGQCRGRRMAMRKALCPKLQSKVQTPPPSELLTFSHKRRTYKNETLN